jgi:hypothetical protein
MLLFEMKWDGSPRRFGPLHYMICRRQSIPSFLMTMPDDPIETDYCDSDGRVGAAQNPIQQISVRIKTNVDKKLLDICS